MRRAMAHWASAVLVCLCPFAVACGGSTPEADAPDSAAAGETPMQPAEPVDSGSDLDVGMEFDDEGEESADEQEQARQHAPPPTTTYRPMRKMKKDAEK